MTGTITPASIQGLFATGLIRLTTGSILYALGEADVEADTRWALSMLSQMGARSGSMTHIIGAGTDWLQLWPWESAVMLGGNTYSSAEANIFDASRSEMFLRRFDLAVVIGVNATLLDFLSEIGADTAALLNKAGAVVATHDASERLDALGVAHWRMHLLGPVCLLESPSRNGARYDQSQWLVEEQNGELLVTSIASRLTPLVRLRTAVCGSVSVKPDGTRSVILTF